MFNFRKKKDPIKTPESIIEQLKILQEENEKLKQEIEQLKEKEKDALREIGVVRFNPFSDSGGNQSFSAAFLNSKGDGMVITSLFSQGGNRVYGKPIASGGSQYSLTKEEKQAISIAKNKNRL